MLECPFHSSTEKFELFAEINVLLFFPAAWADPIQPAYYLAVMSCSYLTEFINSGCAKTEN